MRENKNGLPNYSDLHPLPPYNLPPPLCGGLFLFYGDIVFRNCTKNVSRATHYAEVKTS